MEQGQEGPVSRLWSERQRRLLRDLVLETPADIHLRDGIGEFRGEGVVAIAPHAQSVVGGKAATLHYRIQRTLRSAEGSVGLGLNVTAVQKGDVVVLRWQTINRDFNQLAIRSTRANALMGLINSSQASYAEARDHALAGPADESVDWGDEDEDEDWDWDVD